LRRWRDQRHACAPLKPVLSGYEDASLMDSDSAKLLEASGQQVTRQAIAAVSPWRFRAPLAPPAAAKLERQTIDFDAVVQFCRGAIDANADAMTLIETAGGVMSPLTHDRTMLDLIVALNAPVVLVTGTYLGAVSHTLTALEALRARGTALLIVNESETGVGLSETVEMVGVFHPNLPMITVARGGDLPAELPRFQ
jgi:dethiobiotin synthetase